MSVDFETVASGFYLEALLVDGDTVWYGDIVTGGIKRLGTDVHLLPDRKMIGGLLANADGSLLIAGEGGIVWIHPESGKTGTLIDGLDGVNEMRGDGRGGMVFGTIDLPGILRGEKPGPSSIYHLGADRPLSLQKEGLSFANGLSLNADGSRLYFNESFHGVNCWRVNPDGSLGAQLWFVEKYDCDGMALDAEGNIWISGFASGELLCLTPDGSEVCRLALPGPACTNVRFGGTDMRDLYVTMVDPKGAQALAEGRVPDEQNSALYKGRSEVAGAAIARTCFNLQ